MGAQATGLMGCSLHPCTVAPEGGAPAQADVSCIAVGRGEPSTAAQAQVHPVQGTLLLFPVGTISHGTGTQQAIGKVQEVPYRILPDGWENANPHGTSGYSHGRLTARAKALRLPPTPNPFPSTPTNWPIHRLVPPQPSC